MVRGAGWLMTCAVMSAKAKRGERRVGSDTGVAALAWRLEGGGSPVDAGDEERRLMAVVKNETA